MIVAAVATIPVLILQAQGSDSGWVIAGDWAVWSVFFIEFGALVAIADDRRVAARANWSSLAITVVSFPLLPSLFALSRLVRLVRLLRLLRLVRLALVASRGFRALHYLAGRRELLSVGGAAAFLVLVAAGALSLVEPEHGGFWDSLWWAFVTTTTVGYGDIAPTTLIGRVAAVVLMLIGIGLIATLAAAMASYFVSDDTRNASSDAVDLADLGARLARIEALLAGRASHDAAEPDD